MEPNAALAGGAGCGLAGVAELPTHDIDADMPGATRVLDGVAFCDVDAGTARRASGKAGDGVVDSDDLTGVGELVDGLAIVAVGALGERVVAGEGAGAGVCTHLCALES